MFYRREYDFIIQLTFKGKSVEYELEKNIDPCKLRNIMIGMMKELYEMKEA